MGVPALFRWLSNKYPKIISPVIEETPQPIEGQEVPVDISKPNPNGVEYDNLYLDMNGIVHPCSHPEDRPPPKTEEEMMTAIFEYTDRVVNMVRPRKLLMIAIGKYELLRYRLRAAEDTFYQVLRASTYCLRWRGTACEDEPAAITALPIRSRSGAGR
jgi:XRN 5'-3' exonuclease N-terminus